MWSPASSAPPDARPGRDTRIRRASLHINLGSNLLGFAVQAVTTFALTPIILGGLGPYNYGLWSIIVGLTGYYGLFDLGLRAGLTQYLTRHLATDDVDGLNRTLSTGVLAMSSIGIAAALLGAAFAYYAPGHFGLPVSASNAMRWAIFVAGLSISVQFVLFPFGALLPAVERFDLANGIGVATRLLTFASTWLVMSRGGGLVSLSIIVLATTAVDYAWRTAVAFRLVPRIRVSFRLASRRTLSELASYGFWNATIAAGIRVISYTDSIVIGAALGAAAVAPFAIAGSLVNYFAEAIIAVTQVFFPAMTRVDARQDPEALKQLYVTGSRLTLLLVVVGVILIALFSGDFLRLWVGADLGPQVEDANTILQVLLFAAGCSAWQRVGCQVLLATRRVPLLAKLFAAEAAANIVLSILLVRRFGAIGVALGTLLPSMVFNLLVNPVLVCRRIGLRVGDYLAAVVPRPAATAVLVAAVGLLCRPSGHAASWPDLMTGALRVAVAASVVIAIMWTRTLRRLAATST